MNLDALHIVLIRSGIRSCINEILHDPYGEKHPEERDRFLNHCDDILAAFDQLFYERELIIHVKD